MNLQAEKIKLSQIILNIESKHLIEQIKLLIKKEEGDLWDELHDDVKKEVELAIEELDKGKGLSHTKVLKTLSKWLKK